MVLAGLIEAVTPLGKPETENPTVPLKPPCAFTVMALPPLAPGLMLTAVGVAVRVKPEAAAVTVRPIVTLADSEPDVPVTVTVAVPAGAFEAALKFSGMLLPDGVPHAAVTPEGTPLTETVTEPLKPLCGASVMVLAPLPPGLSVTLDGFAVSVNEADPVIVSVRRALLVSVPDVPVMVSVAVVGAADALTFTVSRLLVVAFWGLNDAVTPAGRPETPRLTVPLKPFCALTVMVLVPLLPGAIDSVDADEDKLNDGTLGAPVRSLISDWPAGVPQPVARS